MEAAEDFLFPFTPYSIQIDFMKNLYTCLENGNLGIFESPTGTGKTMSLICGALKWLMDNKQKQKTDLLQNILELEKKIKECQEKNKSDWFFVQTEKIELNAKKQIIQNKYDALLKQEEKFKKYKETIKAYKDSKAVEKKKREMKWTNKQTTEKDSGEKESDFFDEDLLLKDTNDCSNSSEEEDDNLTEERECKIFFCSRTHSQLSQFIGELKKSPYVNEVSLVPLASRNNYCINSKVKSLKNINVINEQCQLLQKKKTATVKAEKDVKRSKTTTSCPYMPGDQSLLMAEILTSIRDIEDVVKVSEDLKTCPYYSTRKCVDDGQIILVPYNSVLHKSTRESLGINLKGSVLIIDEAHNLLEAIERMYSVTVTGKHILHSLSQLSQYQERFKKLLTAKNVLLLSQLHFCLKKLVRLLGGTSKSNPDDKPSNACTQNLYSLDDFEMMAEIDTLNIYDVVDFVKKSRLVHKLRGFVEKYGNEPVENNTVKQQPKGVTAFLQSLKQKDSAKVEEIVPVKKANDSEKDQISSPLMIIISFLETLKTKCNDGRIFIIPKDTVGEGYLRFLLLNPAAHFSDIVEDARAIILAGGTMQPMSEFRDQLFLSAGAKADRIVSFSCDHVIPKENILTCILRSGPTGVEFEFNYQNRQNSKLLDELCRSLINLCNIVPAGIVVFLPSYGYEELLYNHLESKGYLIKISSKKCVFREPKSSTQVNQILEKYAEAVKKPLKPKNGAILFSVVGGKLSEGLNFSDELGRCVVVVGMPYPNIKSTELQEKMKYLKENLNADAGNMYYENACMKAVNQCIGRAVRHINDYATVILLDRRYVNKQKALPGWIQRTLSVQDNFGGMVGALARFFSARREKT